MSLVITLHWWEIPTALSVLAFLVWWRLTPEEYGIFAGLGAVLMLVPTFFFVLLVWLIAAILK